ncbi:hypothetical protein B0H34DRAFT_682568 [Crassisporium funariophilum]|nr:hypothetical protein B0H34DRAFT_682568 [Crassisporium funariophilum]
MSTSQKSEKKAHICPPSTAIHPSDRWESLFVYSFICKFTNLRHKIEGLESPMDLENALLEKEPNSILSQLLVHFITNLKPQTRNLSMDQISATVASVLSEYFKSSERTIFWDEERKANLDPFEGLEGGFFATNWDFKLKILRQLVELQLSHAPEVKGTIDRAWGVVHNKHKKNQTTAVPLDPTDPKSQESLQILPIGQDYQRKRYWISDDSPRVYVSTNPWKITATFRTISSTREEYVATIEDLKRSTPPEKGQKRTKLELAHLALITALEGRIEAIDAEIGRVQRVRKKIEQRRLLYAQAEVRQTRTRRQTQKPDYVYNNDMDSEDDGADEYSYQEEGDPDEEYDQQPLNGTTAPRRGRGKAGPSIVVPRRSGRTSAVNGNGKRESSSDSWLWRGERRSSRLGGPDLPLDVEPSRKRARTEESMTSSHSNEIPPPNNHGVSHGIRVKTAGAAALKPTEIALEQIAGKKKSKFWVYAVEPMPGAPPPAPLDPPLTADEPASSNGNGHKVNGNGHYASRSPRTNGQSDAGIYDKSLEGSLSPMNSA